MGKFFWAVFLSKYPGHLLKHSSLAIFWFNTLTRTYANQLDIQIEDLREKYEEQKEIVREELDVELEDLRQNMDDELAKVREKFGTKHDAIQQSREQELDRLRDRRKKECDAAGFEAACTDKFDDLG